MKFLHTSDWHLGACEEERSLEDDQRCFINEICDIIEREHIDAVLIAGDVYDRANAAASAVRLYDTAMTKICAEQNTPILMIAGNHDSADRIASCGELLRKANLYVAGSAEAVPKSVLLADTEFFLLPWVTEDKVKSLYPEKREQIDNLTDAYRILADAMRERFTEGKKHVVLAHAFLTNAETSTSDHAAEIGTAVSVSADVFEGFDYVALGHIHKPQDVNDHVRYCGTPMIYSFGKEESQEKSVTIVDTETMEKTIVPLHPLRKRKSFTGTYDELLAPSCSEAERTGFVSLTVTDTAVGLELLSKLREVYPNLIKVMSKTYDSEDSSITLTMEELERMESDPVEVFKSFCREQIKQEPEQHFVELFEQAVRESEEKNQ